jgi:hypothetical protein
VLGSRRVSPGGRARGSGSGAVVDHHRLHGVSGICAGGHLGLMAGPAYRTLGWSGGASCDHFGRRAARCRRTKPQSPSSTPSRRSFDEPPPGDRWRSKTCRRVKISCRRAKIVFKLPSRQPTSGGGSATRSADSQFRYCRGRGGGARSRSRSCSKWRSLTMRGHGMAGCLRILS